MLANESGGRYFEAEEKEIAREVKDLEGGYYEVSFPDKPEYKGEELDIEIRALRTDIVVLTVKEVGREKSFRNMTELEREVLVLNVLNRGPFALTKEKVIPVEVKASREGDEVVCTMALPEEFAGSECEIFKVARNDATGDIRMDKDTLIPGMTTPEIRMKWRGEGYRHDVVLVHTKTGAILVAE